MKGEMGMKKILVILGFWWGGLYASACSYTSKDPATQFAFNVCVANFINQPSIAITGVVAYLAKLSSADQIGTACSWCRTMIQGSSSNTGGMTSGYYDAYSSNYGNLSQINYQSLAGIFNDAGVMNFINQGSAQQQAFVNCYVNQCGVRQVPGTKTVSNCVTQCITLAQQYLTWFVKQQLSSQASTAFNACVIKRGCWNYGQYGFGCFTACAAQQAPFKPTALPWIASQ